MSGKSLSSTKTVLTNRKGNELTPPNMDAGCPDRCCVAGSVRGPDPARRCFREVFAAYSEFSSGVLTDYQPRQCRPAV